MGAKWSRNGGRSETKLHMAPPPPSPPFRPTEQTVTTMELNLSLRLLWSSGWAWDCTCSAMWDLSKVWHCDFMMFKLSLRPLWSSCCSLKPITSSTEVSNSTWAPPKSWTFAWVPQGARVPQGAWVPEGAQAMFETCVELKLKPPSQSAGGG